MERAAWLASNMRDADLEFTGEQTRMLREARRLFYDLGYGVLSRNDRAFRCGDADQLKGLDDVAEQIAARFPGMLGSDPESRLFELLLEGNPRPLSVRAARQEAEFYLEESEEPMKKTAKKTVKAKVRLKKKPVVVVEPKVELAPKRVPVAPAASEEQLQELGKRWLAGEKIRELASELGGVSWNWLHGQLTRRGFLRIKQR